MNNELEQEARKFYESDEYDGDADFSLDSAAQFAAAFYLYKTVKTVSGNGPEPEEHK